MNTALYTAQQWLTQTGGDGINLGLSELLWYQRHTNVLNLTPNTVIQSKLAGSYLARSKGRGMEFDEVRHYQPGDDVRTIDWRVTARTGKTHTKLFREEKERPVFILTDLSDSMHFGSQLLFKSVQAAHLAALIAWHVKQRGDKLGGLIFSQYQHRELKPQSRTPSVLHYFHALTEIHQQQHSGRGLELATALGQLRRLIRPGSLVFVLSDFTGFNDDCLRHLRVIRQHNEITCCQLTDPLEQQLPANSYGLAAVTDGQQQRLLDLGSKTTQQRYQQQQQQQQQQLAHWLKQAGCKLLTLSAAEPVIRQLERKWHG